MLFVGQAAIHGILYYATLIFFTHLIYMHVDNVIYDFRRCVINDISIKRMHLIKLKYCFLLNTILQKGHLK